MARFRGTTGPDNIDGTEGPDIIRGFRGDDRLGGAQGDDRVRGNRGTDSIGGGLGNDVVRGNAGNDAVNGGDGDDTIWSGSSSGTDLLDGATGNDHFVLRNASKTKVSEGRVVIEDSGGVDTVDVSRATGSAIIDLDSGGSFGGRELVFSGGGAVFSPLDLIFAQDLSGSYSDDIGVVRGLIDNVADAVLALQPDTEFAVTSFVDKPISPFGSGGDYAYRTDLALTDDVEALVDTYDALRVLSGGDFPESQFEALLQIALRETELGYRSGSTQVVVLFTDATGHVAGAFPSRPANNGDDVLDGAPPSTGEDYPSLAQVRDALLAADIIPVFAATSDVTGFYRSIVTQWEFGSVVQLSSNSSNIVSAIKAALDFATTAVIENAIGSDFDDTLQGNAVDNALTGGTGADTFIFEDEAGGTPVFFGDDTIVDFSQAEGDVIRILGGLDFTQAELAGDTILTFDSPSGPDSTITVLGATGLVIGVDILV